VARRPTSTADKKPVLLLVLEGYTEEVFYSIIRDTFLHAIRVELRNMKGRGNVNKDVLSEIYKYMYNNPNDLVRAYCCVDTERQRQSATPFDLDLVRQEARDRQMKRVLSVDAILADPDIESWFFYDIEGIYKFLRAKKSQRTTNKYSNPTNLSKKDLQRLFARFEKVYTPGKRAERFIASLNIRRMLSCCTNLSEGIARIKAQADNLTNHLF